MTTDPQAEFDLTTAAGWSALRATWLAATASAGAATHVHTLAERAAHEGSVGAPGDAGTHDEAMQRLAANEAAGAAVGLPQATAAMESALDVLGDLQHAALSSPAPNAAALTLKLDMVSEPWGWNDFDADTWPVFVADLRRFLPTAKTQAA